MNLLMHNNFPPHQDDFAHGIWSIRRYKFTLAFLEKHIPKGSTLFDIGTMNGLGNFIRRNGYEVTNTQGEDFDSGQGREKLYGYYPCMEKEFYRPENIEFDAVTCFEVLEHLVDPMCFLKALPGTKLVASVPLRLWFAKAYRSKTNPAGFHYHEFENCQFDMLLEKSGWTILDRESHTAPTFKLGFRSVLRWVTKRYYLIYAERL